jgi:hypothetical protein
MSTRALRAARRAAAIITIFTLRGARLQRERAGPAGETACVLVPEQRLKRLDARE